MHLGSFKYIVMLHSVGFKFHVVFEHAHLTMFSSARGSIGVGVQHDLCVEKLVINV